jgi:hypothetical protein
MEYSSNCEDVECKWMGVCGIVRGQHGVECRKLHDELSGMTNRAEKRNNARPDCGKGGVSKTKPSCSDGKGGNVLLVVVKSAVRWCGP